MYWPILKILMYIQCNEKCTIMYSSLREIGPIAVFVKNFTFNMRVGLEKAHVRMKKKLSFFCFIQF